MARACAQARTSDSGSVARRRSGKQRQQRQHRHAGQHRGDDQPGVPRRDAGGPEQQQRDGDQRDHERRHGGEQVVAEAGDVGQPGREVDRHRPQPRGEHRAGRPGAPAVLLAQERAQPGRAHAGGQHQRHVGQVPARPAHVQAGVHVLGVGDERRAALRLQRLSSAHRAAADADRRAEPVPAHLDGPVEQLLDGPRRALHRVRPRRSARKYCGVCTIAMPGSSKKGLGRLGQEIRARREVGVQDQDERTVGMGECVPEVPGLLCSLRLGRTT